MRNGSPCTSADPRRILIVVAHPRGGQSLSAAIAASYAAGARSLSSAHIRIRDLSRAHFDSNVRTPSPCDHILEPDLVSLRGDIEWAAHLVFVFPTWWGTMPALLKGMLDRVLTPDWAFRVTEGGSGYEGCLAGRTAEIVTTMDTPALVYRVVYGAPGYRALAGATLGFCGIEVRRITRFGPVRGSTGSQRETWLARAHTLGALAAAGRTQSRRRLRRRAFAWLRALRLQFYPLTFLAYLLGALAALRPLDMKAFWLGYAMLFCVEAATVFGNELIDEPSDRRNRHYGPFSGGSRVLIEGKLSRVALQAGSVAASTVALGLLTILGAYHAASSVTVTLLGATSALAVGYTLPPLRLCYRGLGEITVALTHGFGALYAGYLLQQGDLGATVPLALSICLAAAILPSILLAGVPDAEADRRSGKRTLAVLLGVPRTCALAAAMVALSAVLPTGFLLAGMPHLQALAGVAPLHAAAILCLMGRRGHTLDRPQRIDLLLVASLSYILWFVLLPMFGLRA
jgi:putative NADPH-quinone reductase/1,4-dihydroxy-2-naphthoate octaprenyltransferase